MGSGVESLRKWVLTGGMIVLAAGLVYMFVALPGIPSSGSGEIGPGQALIIDINYPFSLGYSPTVTVHWTAVAAVNVTVVSCGESSKCDLSNAEIIANGSGETGKLSFSALIGHHYGVVTTAATDITYSCAVLSPYFYLALPVVLAGAALLIVAGFWVRLHKGTTRSSHPPGEPEPRSRAQTQTLFGLMELFKAKNATAEYRCQNCGHVTELNATSQINDVIVCPSCEEPLKEGDIIEILRHTLE